MSKPTTEAGKALASRHDRCDPMRDTEAAIAAIEAEAAIATRRRTDMQTGPANRHKHSIGGKFSTIVEAHDHDLRALEAALAAGDGVAAGRLDALDARLTSVEARLTALETTAPSPPPPSSWPWATLQEAIDATPDGGTLDATGRMFSERVVIARPMTLRGGFIAAAGGTILAVRAPDVTLDGPTVSGGGTDPWEMGIHALGADRLRVRSAVVRDLGYAGIMVLESAGVEVTDCLVERIGLYATGAGNAYGIAVSNVGGPQSSDWIVARNRVDRVPNWHGIDTHAGIRGIIIDNRISHCNRAIFVTLDSYGRYADDVEVSRNTCNTPTPRADVLNTRPWNEVGITVVTGCANVRGAGNILDGWPVGNAIDVQGSGAVFTGTVVTNPV